MKNLSLLIDIVMRMKDPNKIKDFMLDSKNYNPDPLIPDYYSWDPLSLSDGYPALLILFATLNEKGLLGEEGDAIIHQYVCKIKDEVEATTNLGLSLFSGVTGVCFAVQRASSEGRKYQSMLNTLNAYLLKNVEKTYLKPIEENIANGHPCFSFHYDIIQGVSGIGRYALDNISNPSFLELTENIVTVLVKLSNPLSLDGAHIPGWYISGADPLNRNAQASSSKGEFNLGLAHGVPGVLAFLSIALLKGVEVKGQIEAINYISNWICQRSLINNSLVCWPYTITWEEEIANTITEQEGSKDAWCYGSPGIVRSLFLAGKATKNHKLKSFAVQSFQDIFSRSRSEWQLPGPSLCHGIAGLLLITNEMSKELECKHLLTKVNKLKKLILSYYNPDFPFGFKDVEPTSNGSLVEISKPGLLEGSAGIILTLLSLSESTCKWHLPFLIHV